MSMSIKEVNEMPRLSNVLTNGEKIRNEIVMGLLANGLFVDCRVMDFVEGKMVCEVAELMRDLGIWSRGGLKYVVSFFNVSEVVA